MKKFYLFFLFLLLYNFSFTQEWSEPINISNMEGIDHLPDLIIDNRGVMHCVWIHMIDQPFRKVYYSKSEDNGETWSEPEDISLNTQLAMTNPHIINDSENNLYVTYDYDVYNIYNHQIHFRKYNGEFWSDAINLSAGYPGSYDNKITVDNNDRIYVFWYLPTRFYYRYYKYDEWSEVICPYNNEPFIYLKDIISDNDNLLHCIGVHYFLPNERWMIYFTYDRDQDEWSDFGYLNHEDVYANGSDITLDRYEYPHIVWHGESGQLLGGNYYKFYNGNYFQGPELFAQNALSPLIQIKDDTIYILSFEVGDPVDDIVMYTINEDSFWGSQVIYSADYAAPAKFLYYNDYLYFLFFGRVESEDIDIYILKSHINSNNRISLIQDNDLISLSNNSPNPFYVSGLERNSNTKIDYSLKINGLTTLKIFNIKGELIKKIINEHKKRGNYSAFWDGTDKAGNQVTSGIYLYQLKVGNYCITKVLTKIK